MRFRLKKMPFLQMARYQIEGGVWYKPGWYDAARRVPPVAFQPRPHKKKHVPQLRWEEDALIREFQERNPGLVDYDPVDPQNPERHVATAFARQQLAAMGDGLTKEEAYAAAREWALANGRALAAQLHLPDAEAEALAPDDITALSPRAMMAETLRRQKEQIKASLADDLAARPENLGEWGSVEAYKHWHTEADIDAIGKRTAAVSREARRLPRDLGIGDVAAREEWLRGGAGGPARDESDEEEEDGSE
mmetsp:Transcript_29424/g.69637  ORF Transcript_29424/g.69637 Transcript_29424/m.69637 type:complete len:249 (-) Transcript_29424:7-753(-)